MNLAGGLIVVLGLLGIVAAAALFVVGFIHFIDLIIA